MKTGQIIIRKSFKAIGKSFFPMGKSFKAIGKRYFPMRKGFDPIGKKFDPIGKRFDPIGKRFYPIGKRFDPIGKRFFPIRKRFFPIGKKGKGFAQSIYLGTSTFGYHYFLIKTTIMSTVKMGLSKLSVPKLADECDGIVTALTGNASYPTPVPTLDVVSGAIKDTRSAYIAGLDGGKTLKATVRVNAAILRGVMKQLAAYVQQQSGGDQLTILSSGFGVRNAAGPKMKMAQVTGLRSLPNTTAAQAILDWAPVTKAKSYVLQTTPTPAVATSWVAAGNSTKSTAVVTGLTSGTVAWFRVAALGPLGQGPWSDPAMQMVN